MASKTSKLIEALKDKHNAEIAISKEMTKKTQAEEYIKSEVSGLFSKNAELKELINQAIFDNFSEEYKKKIIARRKDLKEREENNISIYDYCILFDPNRDGYTIDNYVDNGNNEVKFQVSCIKNNSYLGRTGAWIPDQHWSAWIPIEKIIDLENNK